MSLQDKVDGLESDLQSAVDLMVRVARGEQTVQGMGEWISLNYPKHREQLPAAMRALPPQRES
jgi:hypothetical protein